MLYNFLSVSFALTLYSSSLRIKKTTSSHFIFPTYTQTRVYVLFPVVSTFVMFDINTDFFIFSIYLKELFSFFPTVFPVLNKVLV